MALESGQPIGHLCDLLGIPRFQPSVFDVMVELMGEGSGDDVDSKVDALSERMGRKR